MTDKLTGRRPVLITGAIYTVAALLTVISAWITGLHRYDLSNTVSEYIALSPWTAVMYLVSAAVMVTLIFIYIKRRQMPKYRKILYGIIFACVFGCALFPCNYDWSRLTTEIHNYFAIGLMLGVTISFVMLLIKGRTKAQRILGIAGVLYAAYFIVCYLVIDLEFFSDTILIWENTFIYLLLAELFIE